LAPFPSSLQFLRIRGWPGIEGFAVGVGIVLKGMLDFRGIYRRGLAYHPATL